MNYVSLIIGVTLKEPKFYNWQWKQYRSDFIFKNLD